MIAVIGPDDSVRIVLNKADELDIADVVGRPYKHMYEALALSDDADARHCQVILFTGAFPYALVRAHRQPLADLQYISHGGVDLLKNLLQISLEEQYRGGMPRMSFDTADPDELDRTLADFDPIDLPRPKIIEFDTSDPDAAEDRLFEEHRKLYVGGEVELCLTSSSGAFARLGRDHASINARRITHAAVEVARSLQTAALQRELVRGHDARPCIALAETGAGRPDTSAAASWRRQLRAVTDEPVQLIEDGDHIRFQLTHGAARRWLHTHPADHPDHLGLGSDPDENEAAKYARKALKEARRLRACVLLSAEGRLTSSGHAQTRPRARSALAATANKLGITPESLQSLSNVLVNLPSHDVTAADVAAAYNVSARHARKILTGLAEAGYAEKVGQAGHHTAGRPRTVYRVDLEALNQ